MIWYIFSTNKKTHFGHSENGKLIFRPKKMKTTLDNIVFHSKMHPCTIWDQLNKLCHECGHEIERLGWNPWIFTHDSSFLRTLFQKNCRITSLLFFLVTWSHIITQCEGFPIFFWIFYARFKMRLKRRAWLFLASGWILENFLCFSYYIDTYVPRNNFWKK